MEVFYYPSRPWPPLILESLAYMTWRDWLVLLVISAIVAVCGVVGVSYVAGEGEAMFDAVQVALLSIIFTVVCAAALFLIDVLFTWICETRATERDAAGSNRAAIDPDAAEYGYSTTERAATENARDTTEPGETRFNAAERDGAGRKRPPRLAWLTPRWNARSIAIFSCIMALFWAPWLVANFPGGTYWDTYYQIFQVYPENHPIAVIPWAEIYDKTLTDAWLVDHHPVLTTLLYGAFGWVSDQLTGTWMAGVFAFCLLQGIAHVIVFTAGIAYVRERNCPLVLCFMGYVFLCIMPFVSTWAMCMVKDSLFGLFCVPYFLMLFEALRTHGASLNSGRAIALFTVLGLILCLTRKMGIFLVVPTAIVAAIALRRGKGTPFSESGAFHACLVQGITCIVCMAILLPMVVFPLANIAPGGTQETLGPLFQQTARYLRDHGDEVTVAEKRAVSAVLDYDKLADQYQYDFADSVKYRYNLDATPEQLINYLHAWATMGARHPDAYLAASASLAGFYVAPTAFANIRMVTVDTHMGEDDRYMLWNPDELDPLREGLDEAYTTIAEIPGVNFPLLIVTYAFWLPAAAVFIIYHRRLRCGVLVVPALILLAFCIISPVYDARYCVPIFDLAPYLVCTIAAVATSARDKILADVDVETDFEPQTNYNGT